MILGFSFAAWLTIAVVLAIFGTLIFTKLPADAVFLGGIAILFISGVLDAKEALAGFNNTSVVMVGALFIVVEGLVRTGVLHWMMRHLLGTPPTWSRAIVRLMLPVAAFSSFLSNTTVVALFVNVVRLWARKLGISPSKLLIPLSYASGMGGICTLIGTPPNLIISGMYTERTGLHMNMFTPLVPGLFCLAVGVFAILALRRLLPDRKAPEDAFSNTSDYTAEFIVPSTCRHVGETVGEAGLIEVRGGQLLEVVGFDDEVISPVRADTPVVGGDRLIYCGAIDELLELRTTHGLINADKPVFSLAEEDRSRQLKTACVRFGSALIGHTWSEHHLKGQTELTLVAVSRHGERLQDVPRQIKLKAGDTLLIECAPHATTFGPEIEKALEFFDSDEVVTTGWGTFVSSLIMLAMVALSALKIVPLLQSCFAAALAMVVFRCCSPRQAMKSINWSILMIFAGSVVLGSAIQKTGLAEALANGVVHLCGPHPLLVMCAVTLAATFITEFISNTAAGAMFCPIVYETATSLGCDPLPFLVALMIAVSSSFATPIGSSTHMLVYGPGGYRFTDFLKIGFWMNLIILAANLLIVNLLWPIHAI